jgi:PAS domain S-box-containing protein
MKKGYRYWSGLLVVILVFITITVFLVIKISNLRQEKQTNTFLINELTFIESGSFNQLVNIDDYNSKELSENLELFKQHGRQLKNHKGLDTLNLRLYQLDSYVKNTAHNVQSKLLKLLYRNINNESRKVISSLRVQNLNKDLKLNRWFFYNVITMFVACGLGIVVLILRYFQLGTRIAYSKISKMHDLLLESSIDFVMSSNGKGEIVEFNKASQKAFGYSLREAKDLNEDVLFYNLADNAKVIKSLNEFGYFKGEIVNKRKNGEPFTTFLSANVILDKGGERLLTMGISRDISFEKLESLKSNLQTREIQQSIEYASELQSAMLPTRSDIAAIFPDYFLIFKPKDILSGDFYLVEKVVSKDTEEFVYLVLADCTGHGIPGSLLSTFCNSTLRAGIKMKSIQTPGKILDFARNRIVKFFHSTRSKNRFDGMDAAICKFDLKNLKLYFSGANSCCYIIRKGELTVLKGTKQSVSYCDNPQPFDEHIFQLDKGDCIYLTSDGFVDQFGGPKNKKFMKKRLFEILLAISDNPISVQGQILEDEFVKWKGDENQTDDVLFFGLRI